MAAQTRGSRSGDSDNPTTDRFASMAHETIDRVAEAATHAEREVRAAATRTAAQARDVHDQAIESADDHLRKTRSYIEENPLASAAFAFVAGLLLSALIKR
jgi:ElaB/YqjD/DUF883 family membrane-anchored ribosome-binding protein